MNYLTLKMAYLDEVWDQVRDKVSVPISCGMIWPAASLDIGGEASATNSMVRNRCRSLRRISVFLDKGCDEGFDKVPLDLMVVQASCTRRATIQQKILAESGWKQRLFFREAE